MSTPAAVIAASQRSKVMRGSRPDARSRGVAQADVGEGRRRQTDQDCDKHQIVHHLAPQKAAVSATRILPFAMLPVPSLPLLKLGCRYADSRCEMSVSMYDTPSVRFL